VPSHVNAFRLNPNIQQVYAQHEVVITHGGAGTLLACLCHPSPKKIIAIANNTLANNHQTELIAKLH
jgi:UDP-N-acetylglucosamine transferase subunit ALG13